MSYDSAVKSLLHKLPERLFRRLTGSVPVELLNTEYPTVQMRRPDFVARLADGRLYHLEVQSTADRAMPWRMLEYYALLRRHYDELVLQQVLYIGQPPWPGIPASINDPTLQFSYGIVDIRNFEASYFLESADWSDAVFAVLVDIVNPRHTIQAILQRLQHIEGKELGDALEQLLVLCGLRRLTETFSEEVSAMTDMLAVLNEYPFFHRMQHQARLEGECKMLRIVLENRFGQLPDWASARLSQADEAQLHIWVAQALSSTTLEQALTDTAQQ